MMTDPGLKLTQSGYNFRDCCKANFGVVIRILRNHLVITHTV
jgi:hypothetical protein